MTENEKCWTDDRGICRIDIRSQIPNGTLRSSQVGPFLFSFSFFFFSFFIFIFLFLFFYPHPRLLSPFLARPPLRPMYDPCRYAAELSAERRCAQALIAPSYQIKLEDEYHFCHEFVVQFGTMSGPKKINK